MANVNYEFCLDMQGARMERTNKRLFILVILLIVSLLATNAGWLFYSQQFDEEQTVTEINAEQEASKGGENYIIGGDYDVNDKTKSNDNQND